MRISILLLAALLTCSCSSKKVHENGAEIITKIGMITAREDVEMSDVETETRTNTSVIGGVSSGGGFGIGLGFLFSPGNSTSISANPVRYEVKLVEGGQITVYHDSHDFQLDDCVEISVHADEEKYPPTMKRIKSGC